MIGAIPTMDATNGPSTNQVAGAIVLGSLVFLCLVRRGFRGLVVAPS